MSDPRFKSERAEWYDECYEPDAPSSLRIQMNLFAQQFGKSAAMSAERTRQIGSAIHASMATLSPPTNRIEPPETVREKALRWAQRSHSFAQDPYDFHFDHRGRRRY